MSLNCGNSSAFIISRFFSKLFNRGCLKKINYWGIALKAYAKLHLNKEYVNIPQAHSLNWPHEFILSPQSSSGFLANLFDPFSPLSWRLVACVQTITKLWLVPSAKQRRDPCSGPPTDSTNYRKCVSNSPLTWLAITTNKTKAFFNWPVVARTQIWVHSWKSRTRISALFSRRS